MPSKRINDNNDDNGTKCLQNKVQRERHQNVHDLYLFPTVSLDLLVQFCVHPVIEKNNKHSV